MGEVYKGRDTRLDRLVALKLLAPHLAGNSEARERFEREATTVAKLKHAHICLLYDIGKDQGRDFLVLEYLEGETLAERLARGPLPLDHVLQYAIEIADALDKAHRAGVTHRDIKPGNIMVVSSSETSSKTETKLLDFGLAKLKQEVANATLPASERPTIPGGALTQGGTILGTLHYMAPEQLEGKEVDGRADIFSFGAVVHEMATGKKAFPGETQASIIAKILDHNPPPVSSLEPPGKLSPPALDRVVERCLAKDREDRWQAMRDVCHELKWIKEGGAQTSALSAAAISRPRLLRRWALVSALACLIVAGIASLATWTLKPAPATPTNRLVVSLAPGERFPALTDLLAVAISPDGRNIVYVANRGGVQQLYLRSLDDFESRPIPGTEGATTPFFSPDGQWVGFVAQSKLQKVSISGGTPVTVYSGLGITGTYGATWGSDDVIVFQPTGIGPLSRVPAAGGAPQPLAALDTKRGEITQRWPEFLPGGKAVLFASAFILANWSNAQLGLYVLTTGERRNLPQSGTRPRYAPTGHLLYAQGGTLMAMPFDLARLEARGSPVPVAEGIMQSVTSGVAQYSFSDNGTLAYVPGGAQSAERIMVWVDRKGTEPVWSRNGREMFYRSGNKMMAVDVTTQPTFSAGRPRMLFEGPYLPSPGLNSNYDVAPDGQRFLMVKPSGQEQTPTQINVVLNWFEELKRRVPAP